MIEILSIQMRDANSKEVLFNSADLQVKLK